MPPIRRIAKPPFWSGQRPITRPVGWKPGAVKPTPPRSLPPGANVGGLRPEFEAIRSAARAQKAIQRRMR